MSFQSLANVRDESKGSTTTYLLIYLFTYLLTYLILAQQIDNGASWFVRLTPWQQHKRAEAMQSGVLNVSESLRNVAVTSLHRVR